VADRDTRVSFKLEVKAEVSVADLAENLVEGLDDDELIALVKRVDDLVEDPDFTILLFEYFEQQRAMWDAADRDVEPKPEPSEELEQEQETEPKREGVSDAVC
jgi:hypothetical protein